MKILITLVLVLAPLGLYAQELVPDTVTIVKAVVVEVLEEEVRQIEGTANETIFQTIRAEVLDGAHAGVVVTIENDYLALAKGETFYARHITNSASGTDMWSVADPYRLQVLFVYGLIFLVVLCAFGGLQGLRGLMALVASFFFITYLLLPGLLAGYPPVAVALGVSSLIIIVGSYVTHGVNRTTSAAVAGMLATIVVTGALAYVAVVWGRLSGLAQEEAVYLSFNTGGEIDLAGLLLGGLLIGLLGVLYDAAIGQAVAVEELLRAGSTRTHAFARALRIGREHIGALVNTLAIAYVGASLPLLLLLMSTSNESVWVTLNSELFATEVLRTIVGSIGIILAVPITTAVAVYVLNGRVESVSRHVH